MARNILVLGHHGFGDTLMEIPLIRAAREWAGPGARVDLTVKNAAIGAFMSKHASVSQWHLVHGTLPDRLRHLVNMRTRGYSYVIAPGDFDRDAVRMLARLLFPARLVVSRSKEEVGPGAHKVEVYHQAVCALAEETLRIRYGIDNREPVDLAKELALNGGAEEEFVIGIHPGSGERERHKRWPPGHYAEAIAAVGEERPDVRFLVIGGPEESGLVGEILHRLPPSCRVTPVVGVRDLVRLGRIIGVCRAFVSGDSGLAHLANSLGIPQVAMFGPTDPRYTGPWRPCVILRGDCPRSPCYSRTMIEGCEQPSCMAGIRVTAVVQEIRKLCMQISSVQPLSEVP